MKTLFSAAAIAALLATPTLANTMPVAKEQKVQVNISTAGLNLTNQADVAKLRNRVNKAVAEACNPADRFIITAGPADRQCRETALRDADQMVERMAQAAVANRVAQN